MNTADPAGDEDGQSGAYAHPEASGDGGRAPAFAGGDDGEVAEIDFLDALVRSECFEFPRLESDAHGAVVEGEGGGYGAVFSDDVLAASGDFEIAGLGQSVRDDDGLECDDGASFASRAGDFVRVLERKGKKGVQGSSSVEDGVRRGGGLSVSGSKQRATGSSGRGGWLGWMLGDGLFIFGEYFGDILELFSFFVKAL